MGGPRFPSTGGGPVPVSERDVTNGDTRALNPLNILLLARAKRINRKHKRSIERC